MLTELASILTSYVCAIISCFLIFYRRNQSLLLFINLLFLYVNFLVQPQIEQLADMDFSQSGAYR